ncbi:MAG: hypothetical protein KF723_22315 [Rhizobiaceae bacterium]|nr:hypothetical protein [Rhizobiaceae bacterium]
MTDEYRVITTTFRRISSTGLAIIVDRPKHQNGRGGWAIIPRSLLHGSDDLKVEKFVKGQEITIRIREFKAEELGFA